MAEIENFIIRANKFDGFDKVSDELYRKDQRDYIRGQQKQHHKDNLMDDLLKYTDPSDFFTGTPQDPVIIKHLKDILDKGAKMITDNEGLDNAMLYTALSPDINKLSTASQNLKQIAANNKLRFDALNDVKGIDQDKLRANTIQNAYLNPDGTLKDLSKVDPQQDYVDYTLKNSDVYNGEGIDDFVKGAKTWSDKGTVKDIDSRGGYKKYRADLSAPNFLISEKDTEGNHIDFTPPYDFALESGKPLFMQDAKGGNIDTPIKLLKKDMFDHYVKNYPAIGGYILQEQRRYAKKHNIPINSLQAENFSRAVLFDELQKRKWGNKNIIEETKQPQIKNITQINMPGKQENGNITGNEFDNIGDYKYPYGTEIKGGIVYKPDGTKYNGKIDIPKSVIPTTMEASLMSLDTDNRLQSNDDGFITFDIVDGIPQSVGTLKGYTFKRNANVVGQQNIGKGAKFEGEKPFGQRGKQTQATQPQKPMTLAERMKAAKNKK